jgi:broad specificity phosphatase PhoE
MQCLSDSLVEDSALLAQSTPSRALDLLRSTLLRRKKTLRTTLAESQSVVALHKLAEISERISALSEIWFMKILLYSAAVLALFSSLKLDGADPQQSGSPAPSPPEVETIVFLRHGEKPSIEIGQLNCQGLNRALALPRVLTSKFGKPDYIFAPATTRISTIGGTGSAYIRPLATIEPTAIELGMPVNTDFSYLDIHGLQSELTAQKYQNALIFVAWEHRELEKLVKHLVREFHGNPDEVPHWKGKDFESLYVVRITSRDATKSISFTRDREGLSNLSTDCPDAKQQ